MHKILLTSLLAPVLAGCFYVNTSQVPLPQTYEISQQKKMQSAYHWQVLAKNEAKQIYRSIGDTFVAIQTDSSTSFDKAYKELLMAELSQLGARVVLAEDAPVIINYKVQVIHHKDRDIARLPLGAYTALGAGIGVLNLAAHSSQPGWAAIPFIAAAEAFSGNAIEPTKYDLLVSTRTIQDDLLIRASSNLYYINGGDRDHFEQSGKVIKVTDR